MLWLELVADVTAAIVSSSSSTITERLSIMSTAVAGAPEATSGSVVAFMPAPRPTTLEDEVSVAASEDTIGAWRAEATVEEAEVKLFYVLTFALKHFHV